MIGLGYLAIRHTARRWGRSAILVTCIAITFALPASSRVLYARFETALNARAGTTPMLVGAKGSRFDLVFTSLYFSRSQAGTTTLARYEELLADERVEVIPIHARFQTRGSAPIVATTFEYYQRRGLELADGRHAAWAGEAVVGSRAAKRLGIGVGDSVFSDQREAYDITAPPAIKLAVVGVLQRSGSPDDEAVFVDIETAWILEGIAHGHMAAEAIDADNLVIGRSEEHTALSAAVRQYQEITAENAANFHIHGDRSGLPITAILAWPESEKARTIISERIDRSPGDQALVPSRVIDELLAFVLRVRYALDLVAAVLAASTAALVVLIGVLSYRVREDELRTLGEIGASRFAVAQLFGIELLALVGIAALISVGIVGVVAAAASAAGPFL